MRQFALGDIIRHTTPQFVGVSGFFLSCKRVEHALGVVKLIGPSMSRASASGVQQQLFVKPTKDNFKTPATRSSRNNKEKTDLQR